MITSGGRRPTNALLAAVPDAEWALLAPDLEPVALTFRQMLQDVEQPAAYLWFPTNGVSSMVTQMSEGESVEVATTGREGMVGISVILCAQSLAQSVFIQIPGEGLRLPVDRYHRIAAQLPVFGRLLLRFAAALLTQIAQGSACNRLHDVETRCARWLLMSHDRVDGDRFQLTHEFLGQMLGVTRPSVTLAAGLLQKAGLITYSRGEVVIVDRPGLERVCCECYRIITDEFRQLIEPADSG